MLVISSYIFIFKHIAKSVYVDLLLSCYCHVYYNVFIKEPVTSAVIENMVLLSQYLQPVYIDHNMYIIYLTISQHTYKMIYFSLSIAIFKIIYLQKHLIIAH